jgi:hypothetical protein
VKTIFAFPEVKELWDRDGPYPLDVTVAPIAIPEIVPGHQHS